jgi:arylsulfatase A-like enzyme
MPTANSPELSKQELARRYTRAPHRATLASILAALTLTGLLACRGSSVSPSPASVVLILIDTLRADHLGSYGYSRPTSPTIDRLGAEGILFSQARSVAPWTNPAIVALFTGRRPTAVVPPLEHRQAIRTPLPAELPTLAESARKDDVRTLAFVDHPGISPGLGFARGFDTFVRLFSAGGFPIWSNTDGEFVVDEIERHLDGLRDARSFLYVHLVYPHRPYAPPAPYDGMFGPTTRRTSQQHREEMVNAYDAEIRYTDDVVSALLGALARKGLRDNSWVVVTSDHGEGFWEHGRAEHGNSFYDELLRVPLILSPPAAARIRPQRIDTPVSLVDLHPTVLDLLGVPRHQPPGEIHALPLLPLLTSSPAGAPRDLLSQQPHGGDVTGAALLRGGWKLIRRSERGHPPLQLYDLANDPRERENVSAEQPELVRRLERALLRALARDEAERKSLARREPEDLDDEILERLRALGYLR